MSRRCATITGNRQCTQGATPGDDLCSYHSRIAVGLMCPSEIVRWEPWTHNPTSSPKPAASKHGIKRTSKERRR